MVALVFMGVGGKRELLGELLGFWRRGKREEVAGRVG